MKRRVKGVVATFLAKRREALLYSRAAQEMAVRRPVVALTGAGISVDSGIPDFRDPGGLWDRFDPMEYAHIDAFLENPEKVWQMLRELEGMVEDATPNPGHEGLRGLETLGVLTTVITQNIDGLHSRAGNRDVVEFHGNGRQLVCLQCGKRCRREELARVTGEALPRCMCGSVLKPDVIFFGESIPAIAQYRAQVAARQCGVMLVVGTSAMVYPASELPRVAKGQGACIIEINRQETPLTASVTDIFLPGSASTVLPRLTEAVRERVV